MIYQNQVGFRKGLGTLDNIYVINYLVNRQIEKKGGRLIGLSVDLKTAFDSLDRGILIETIKER